MHVAWYVDVLWSSADDDLDRLGGRRHHRARPRSVRQQLLVDERMRRRTLQLDGGIQVFND